MSRCNYNNYFIGCKLNKNNTQFDVVCKVNFRLSDCSKLYFAQKSKQKIFLYTYRVYIVMEYAENGSLLDIIRKDQHIDESRGRRWFKQLVEAVDYCHERGVVHR